jgi:hypothetical protein
MFIHSITIAALVAASTLVTAAGLDHYDAKSRPGHSKGLRKLKSSKSSKSSKPVCLVFGEEDKIEGTDQVQTGEIVAGSNCDATSANWNSGTCTHYEEPFMINRDVGTTTTFVFDEGTLYSFGATPATEPPLGKGALCGSVAATAGDKLILEYFGDLTDPTDTTGYDLQNKHLKHLQNMKYSFWAESCPTAGSSPCPDEFYLNIYTRKDATSTTPWYDCRFDYVPTEGGAVGTWTTFDLYDIKNIVATNVKPNSVSTCYSATTIQEYIDAVTQNNPANYAFAWNIGDSAAPDAGVSGCLDDLQIDLNDEEAVRVYDMESI